MKKLLKALKEKARNCGVNNKENRARKGAYVDCIVQLEAAINYTHSCTELRDKETPKIEDWLKDNFKRLDRHSFTNIHEDTVWLRSELVEVYNQLHP